MQHHGLSVKHMQDSVERWAQSDLFVNRLIEEVCEHPDLTERVLELANSNKIEEDFLEHGNIVEPKTKVDFSLKARRDGFKTRSEHIYCHSQKCHQHKAETSKRRSYITQSTQSEANSEYSCSQSTLSI